MTLNNTKMMLALSCLLSSSAFAAILSSTPQCQGASSCSATCSSGSPVCQKTDTQDACTITKLGKLTTVQPTCSPTEVLAASNNYTYSFSLKCNSKGLHCQAKNVNTGVDLPDNNTKNETAAPNFPAPPQAVCPPPYITTTPCEAKCDTQNTKKPVCIQKNSTSLTSCSFKNGTSALVECMYTFGNTSVALPAGKAQPAAAITCDTAGNISCPTQEAVREYLCKESPDQPYC